MFKKWTNLLSQTRTRNTKLLVELPLSNDAAGGTSVSAIDLGNITNELYEKKGLYQYLKFN